MLTNKTVKQWLEELEEPYKSQALININKDSGEMVVESLVSAIIWGFGWGDTTQGHDYWENLCIELC